MGLLDLQPELRDTDVYQVMTARKVEPNSTDKLLPHPEGVDVKNPLPEWTRLPLSAKIPFVRAPKDYIVYKRGKLGEAVRREGETFDLSDPYNYGMEMKYEPIHDKHLRNFFYSPGNKKILDDMGLLTKENQVKCKLKEYNAYRSYVYNVHKNSVLNALRRKEEIEGDKAEARKFIEAAGRLRENQKYAEKRVKLALRMAAHRRVVHVCQQLLCENRLKKLELVQEKKHKQKEHEKLRLLVSQKNFQEQLKEYKIKSQEVSFQRNIRAQNKWKRVNENEEYKKNVAAQVEEITKLKEVIENWIKKEIYQLKQWDRNTKIYSASRNFSDKRRKARDKFFRQKQLENAKKTEEIRKYGPKSRRALKKEELYKKMGKIYAGVQKIPPNMSVNIYEKHILQDIMAKAVEDDTKLYPMKYWGTNLQRSKKTTDVANSILQCVYIRAVKLYLKQALFKYIPTLITELKHIVILFEEDMTRKDFNVDELRRFTRSFVGQRKGDIYHSPDPFTSYGYLGRLKRKLYKSMNCGVCRCDSESERGPATVQFVSRPSSACVDRDKKVSFTLKEVGKSKPKLQAKSAKGSSPKGKMKQISSILKQCPLRRKLSGEPEEPELAEPVCCEGVSSIEICECNNNLKTVTFTQAITKAESTDAISETDIEKAAMSVTFELKPKVIPIPMEPFNLEHTIFDKKGEETIQDNERMFHDESEVMFSDQISEVNSEQALILMKDQKKLSFKDKESLQDNEIINLINIKNSECNNEVANVYGSSSVDSFCNYTDIFEEIYAKFRKTKKSDLGRINYSSSSTELSAVDEIVDDPINTQEIQTALDGHKSKLKQKSKIMSFDGCNRNNTIKKSKENEHYISEPRFTHGYGSKRSRIRNPGDSECLCFQQEKRKRIDDSTKNHLEAMFTKYAAKEEEESLIESIIQSDFKEEEESDEYTTSIKLAGQFQTAEPDETILDNVIPYMLERENGSKEKETKLSKSVCSVKSKCEFSAGVEQKRGTKTRYPFIDDSRCYSAKYPQKGTDQSGKSYLRQIFTPSYKPKYSRQEERGLEHKGILVKTSYSPAENCSIVPKYVNQYKFKSIDDLKNFIQLKQNIKESHALAAIKTKYKIGTEKFDKSLNVHDLGKYAKVVVPGGSEKYRAYIKTSRLSPFAENKKSGQTTEWDEDYHTKEGPNELLIPGKTISYSRLVTEAAPEVNEVYMEYFERVWPEIPQNGVKDIKTQTGGTPKRNKTDGLPKKAFNSPDDVIEDSRNYKELNRKGVIGFLRKSFGKEKQPFSMQKRQTEHPHSSKQRRDEWSDVSDQEMPRPPEAHKFVFLKGGLFKPDKLKLCQICNTCPASRHKGDGTITEMDTNNFLECAGCGACVHDLMDGTSEAGSDYEDEYEEKHPAILENESSTSGDSKLEIKFMKDIELKDSYFKKSVRNLLCFADLRAVFGEDFDPDKFVYFVKDGNNYVCLNDLLKRRYPLKPFPWNFTRLARLKKNKLPLNEIKHYTPPKDIFINKVAAGYELWEKTKIADDEGVKEEMKWNKVPKKYEKLFSTTVAPANRPPKKLKPVKNRAPTPMPSTTDLVAHIVEESGGNLHAARKMVHELRVEEGLIRCKVDSAARAIMESVTVIAILKLKEGYPSLKSTLSKSKKRFFYQPTGYHTFYAEKLVKALADMLYSLEIGQINFARLQPLVDIILKYVMFPGSFPLLFPESVKDFLEQSDSELCPSP